VAGPKLRGLWQDARSAREVWGVQQGFGTVGDQSFEGESRVWAEFSPSLNEGCGGPSTTGARDFMTSPGAATEDSDASPGRSRLESGGRFYRPGIACESVLVDPGQRPHRSAPSLTRPAQRQLLSACPVCEETILPDAHESTRQDVKHVAVRIVLPFKSHAAVLHRQQPSVRNGNPMRVAGQILQDLFRSARRPRKNYT